MKALLKRRVTYSDIFLILVNLVPLWGVWFRQWDATEVFIIYCLESIIVGIYNVLMMFVAVVMKNKLASSTNPKGITGYNLILFFIIHYGLFVFIQFSIFLDIIAIEEDQGFFFFFHFIIHLKNYLSSSMQLVLLLFIASYGLFVVKDFLLSGVYKTTTAEKLIFAPYARIIVQQICVILGGFILSFGAGKIFILIFVIIKIYFEILLDYRKAITNAAATNL